MLILHQPIMRQQQCIKACRRGQEVHLLFRQNVRIWKKCDLSDFSRGMIVGARQGGLSISETADLLGFSCTTVSEFAENGAKNKKHPVSSSSAGKNLFEADRKATVMQISTLYNRGMQNSISEHTTRQTSRWIGYSSRRQKKVK